jgi:hypothetical protein
VKIGRFLKKARLVVDKPALYPLYMWSFFMCYFIVIYMTLERVFGMDDQFFHIRFAQLFREKGIGAFSDFQSIYFSKMGMIKSYFIYYNFLFYIVLIPFTFISPLVFGMKLYGVFALSTAFLVVYIFLRKIVTKYPFGWTVLFLLAFLQSGGWLARFFFTRPFTLAPAFLVLMLYFIHQKKYGITAIVSFLYFYWHTASFFFPLCLAIGYFVFEQFYEKKPDYKLVLWPFIGTMAAFISAYLISPGIVLYLKDIIFPVIFDTSLTKSTGIAEGAEVYGKDLISVSNNFFLFFAALFVAGSYEVMRYVQYKKNIQSSEDAIDMSVQPLRAMLFMTSIVFFAAIAVSARFLDYFLFFCCLYVAIAVEDFVKFVEIKGKLFRKSLWVSITVIVIFLFTNISLKFYDSLASASSQLAAQKPAEWLDSNLERNKIIFNADWDSFPVLYYFTGDKFRYVAGIEPRFLFDLDPKLYWEWVNIKNGIYCEERECSELIRQFQAIPKKGDGRVQWYAHMGDLIAEAILLDFKTDIIVVSNGNSRLLELMDNSNRFKKEFFDNENSMYAIYRIVAKTP